MELLSETTIGVTTHRLSNAWQDLTHIWMPKISSYTPTKFGTAELYGGYASPKWGSRSFSPDLFVDDWPPPSTLTVKDMLTDSTEAAAVTVFEGTLHLIGYDETEVNYQSFGAEYTKTVDSVAYSGSLTSVFTTYCGATYLNLTLNTTYARSPSPDVDYTTTGENMLIDDLSDIAAFFTHTFYIVGSTLYLVDMFGTNGTSSIDEFGYFRGSNYSAADPVSIFKAGERELAGTFSYGNEVDISPVCHTNTTNIDNALAYIMMIAESDRYRFKVIPEAAQLPNIGQRITVLNESLQESTTITMFVTDVSPNITNSEILIEGFTAQDIPS